MQDASYMVIVPSLVSDTPPLARNPVFLYYSDRFTRPQPFRADIVVSIDDVFEKKMNAELIRRYIRRLVIVYTVGTRVFVLLVRQIQIPRCKNAGARRRRR